MAPFKSRAQAKFLYKHEPKIAKEFAQHTTSMASLPEHVNTKQSIKARMNKHKKALKLKGKIEPGDLITKINSLRIRK